MRTARWYTTTVETLDNEWVAVEEPCTEASEDEANELAERAVTGYCLREYNQPWRVRVYAGYNSCDKLVHELTSAGPTP